MGVAFRRRWLLFAVFIMSLPNALAATTVGERFESFIVGVRDLIGSRFSDTASFVVGLVHVLPVIALGFIVFGLMYYLSRITIFRGDDADRYARWVAAGIAIIGVVTQRVFDVVLAWSRTFLIVAFIVLLVFMFIVFINRNRQSYYAATGEMHKERTSFFSMKADSLKEKRELKKIKEELRKDKKFYDKTDKDLADLDRELSSLAKIYGDELLAVDKIADLLRKAAAAADRNEQNHVHSYVQALTRDLGGLITSLKHDRADTKEARALLEDIRRNIAYAFKEEKSELKEDDHLEKILKRHMQHMHEYNKHAKDPDLEKHFKRILQEGTDMHRHLVEIRNASLALKQLEDRIEEHMESLTKYGYDSKQAAASAVRDAVMTQDFQEAHKQLDHLRSLIEHGRHQAGDISHLKSEMQAYVSRINSNEDALALLVSDIVQKIKIEATKETKEVKVDSKQWKQVASHGSAAKKYWDAWKADFWAKNSKAPNKNSLEVAFNEVDAGFSKLKGEAEDYRKGFQTVKQKITEFRHNYNISLNARQLDKIIAECDDGISVSHKLE